jgi:K+-sensing histidine kinase KdpD
LAVCFAAVAPVTFIAFLNFNRYYFEPIGSFTIDDPENWVAVFSFLTAALIASRLSQKAKQGALAALDRQQELNGCIRAREGSGTKSLRSPSRAPAKRLVSPALCRGG